VAIVAVTNRIPESGLAKLRAEHDVRAWEHEECISREESLRLIAGADAVVTLERGTKILARFSSK